VPATILCNPGAQPGDFVSKVEKVCCHEEDGTGAIVQEKEKNPCHIPWGQLEHLKVPHTWRQKHMNDASPKEMWPEPGPKMYVVRSARTSKKTPSYTFTLSCVAQTGLPLG
jgi:hypothetical protein